MLRIRIIAVGKDKDAWVTTGCEHYLKLLSRFARVTVDISPGLKSTAGLSPAEAMAREAERIEKLLDGNSRKSQVSATTSYTAALSDSGKQYDSLRFAKHLQQWQTHSGGSVTMLIGGAHGLDPRLLKRTDEVLSLSPMTFSHQLVRLVLLEQLYRGFSILAGTDYHK